MSPARTASNEKVVALGSRSTEKLVTSRSGLPVPTKLGRMSPTGSLTVVANAGELMIIGSTARAMWIVFMGNPCSGAPPRADEWSAAPQWFKAEATAHGQHVRRATDAHMQRLQILCGQGGRDGTGSGWRRCPSCYRYGNRGPC